MLRKKNLVQPQPEFRQCIADYFGIPASSVTVEPQPETCTVNIDGNQYAQDQYKLINRYGNTGTPGVYNFKQGLLVRWTGVKVQAL